MNVQGFIKSIGVPREWETKEKTKMYSYPVVFAIPYVDKQGTERSDEIVGELNAANPDYIAKIDDLCKRQSRVNVSLGLAVNEYQGKLYQRIKVWDIQIMLLYAKRTNYRSKRNSLRGSRGRPCGFC